MKNSKQSIGLKETTLGQELNALNGGSLAIHSNATPSLAGIESQRSPDPKVALTQDDAELYLNSIGDAVV